MNKWYKKNNIIIAKAKGYRITSRIYFANLVIINMGNQRYNILKNRYSGVVGTVSKQIALDELRIARKVIMDYEN